jgi:soluble P-type ATPase
MQVVQATRIKSGDAGPQKADNVRQLGAETVIAIGQGSNDAGVLEAAAIGIAVLGEKGPAIEALLKADLVTASIFDALNLVEYPARLVATLRK